MATLFHVKLHSFRCEDLPLKHGHAPDPLLECDFDHFRTFKSNHFSHECNPLWTDFSQEFRYDTNYPRTLKQKMFVVECFSHSRLGKNHLIGSAAIDLESLATGPINVSLMLRDEGASVGRVKFICEMEQISVVHISFRDISVSDLLVSGTVNPYLMYHFLKSGGDFRSTSKQTNTITPSWSEAPFLSKECTMRDLLSDDITFMLKNDALTVHDAMASCRISMSKYVGSMLEHIRSRQLDVLQVTVSEAMFDFRSTVQAQLHATMSLAGIPIFWQMVGGTLTEMGVVQGIPLSVSVAMPTTINSTSVPSPMTSPQKAPVPVPSLPSHTPMSMPVKLPPPVSPQRSPLGPSAVSSAAGAVPPMGMSDGKEPLPIGWEERYDAATGRVYYANHDRKTTQWDRPTGPTPGDAFRNASRASLFVSALQADPAAAFGNQVVPVPNPNAYSGAASVQVTPPSPMMPQAPAQFAPQPFATTTTASTAPSQPMYGYGPVSASSNSSFAPQPYSAAPFAPSPTSSFASASSTTSSSLFVPPSSTAFQHQPQQQQQSSTGIPFASNVMYSSPEQSSYGSPSLNSFTAPPSNMPPMASSPTMMTAPSAPPMEPASTSFSSSPSSSAAFMPSATPMDDPYAPSAIPTIPVSASNRWHLAQNTSYFASAVQQNAAAPNPYGPSPYPPSPTVAAGGIYASPIPPTMPVQAPPSQGPYWGPYGQP